MKSKKKLKIVIAMLIIIVILILSYLVYNNAIYDKNNSESQKDNVNTTSKNKDNIEETKDNEVNDEEVKESASSIPKDETKENKIQVEAKNLDVSHIELVGEEEITINVGDNYIEYGAKAYNTEGKDISNEIKIDSSVDTSKQGRYTVSYSIGNWIVMRYVTVK